ncbi:cadherin domain-containing protein [Rhodopirellula halodulae]|uniref:cadherin domain-containing protein n=1 Tax=Rhodopirellula halodulae TaxID=2894198 RepID=UPI001E61FA67|nr:cadherin domain-containing protein [Rhodopirellula sp. JC737]MCC9656619.1 cadherin domain-containing protein [Rhodopirellula sp. JC737]
MTKREFHFFQLEDRVLLSGEGLDAAEAVTPDEGLIASLQAELDAIEDAAQAAADDSVTGDLLDADGQAKSKRDENEWDDPALGARTLDPARPVEVIFVDEGVENSEILLQDLRSQNEDTQWVVVRLRAGECGVDRITETLAHLSGVDAIHLLSHGDGEGIQLGSDRLSLDSAPAFAGDIASWGHALDTQADLLIYGCDLASTVEGQDLIEMLALVCNCDVAASDDATGHEDLGGDWLLEYTVGEVTTDVAFGYAAQASWYDTLATITVTTTADENDGDTTDITSLESTNGGTGISLREAIIAANNTAGADTIVLGAGTYILDITGDAEQFAATGDLDILSDITITGTGEGDTIIDASAMLDRVFHIDAAGALTLSDLTVTGGAGDGYEAGAVFNQGILVGTDVVFRGNSAASQTGGAIHSTGTTTLTRASLIDNQANSGGALNVGGGVTTLVNVTMSGNTSDFDGGAIRVNSGTLNVDYSTIAANEATSGNGGGIQVVAGTVNVTNSIIADNASAFGGADVNGTLATNTNNLIEDNGGVLGTDPVLSALTLDATSGQYFHSITDSSAAYDAGGGTPPTADIRGETRDASADIGSYEYVAEAPSDLAITSTTNGGISINHDGGNDAYFIVDDGDAILGGLTALTLEMQFNSTSIGNQFTFFSYATVSDQNALIGIVSGTTFQLHIGGGNYMFSGFDMTSLSDGLDHSLAVTWDSATGNAALLIDGDQKTTATGVATGLSIDTGGGTLVFGQEQDAIDGGYAPAQIFRGTLHDIRIFNEVRTDAAIASSYRSDLPHDETGLLANWQFDELSTGGVVTDTVSGNNLTLKNVDNGSFTPSTPTLNLGVDEDVTTGEVIGSVTGTDMERETKISALLAADSDLRYNAETGKFYRTIASSGSWSSAHSAAEATTLSGVFGDLVTIGSASENRFVNQLATDFVGNDVWIGATDTGQEGQWRWQDSDVNESVFWKGDQNGFTVNQHYQNWNATTGPNGGETEDYAFLQESDGTWFDATAAQSMDGYVIQWDADEVLDATEALTYSIQSQTVAGAFSIDSDSGQLIVADATKLDHETNATHTVTVRVTDNDGGTYDEAFTIAVNDVDESEVAASGLSGGIELNLDGGNDAYLVASDGNALFGGSTEFSYEIAFSSTTEDKMTLLSYRSPTDPDDNSDALRLTLLANGNLNFVLNGVATTATGADFSELRDGSLHRLSISWDSSSGYWSASVDGQQYFSDLGYQTGETIRSGGTFLIGQEQDSVEGGFTSDNLFSGTVYDLRVWNQTRSEAEIESDHRTKFDENNLPIGLVANWQMDGFDGSNEVVDVVGTNKLSVGHATGTGYSTSTPVADLHITEGSDAGTSVGLVVPTDPDLVVDLVDDGLFLDAPDPGSYTRYTTGQTFGGWTVESGNVDLLGSIVGPTELGGRSVELNGDTEGAIVQTLTTEIGKQYQVIFSAAGNFSGGADHLDFRASAGGVSEDFVITEGTGWSLSNLLPQSLSLTFTADSTSTDLRFESFTAGSYGAGIGDVRVVEVPEAVSVILQNDSSLSYNAGTGKFYRGVNSAVTYAAATSAATGAQLNGVSGQLLTINSSYENELVQDLIGGFSDSAWLGLTDATTEGSWHWMRDGVESELIWTGTGGGTTNGYFVNWAAGEPNDSGGNEDGAEIRRDSGSWNDTSLTGTNTYVIEWDASEVLSAYTFTLTDDAGGRFAIDNATGEISFTGVGYLDHEESPTYDLTVQTTDAAGHSSSQIVTVEVDNVPDESPSNVVPAGQILNEDSSLTFNEANGNAIVLHDDVGESMRVTLSVDDGTLTLSQTDGLTIVGGGDGTATVTVTGSLENINAALEGLRYDPTADFSGGDLLTITSQDEQVYQLNIDANLEALFQFDSADPANDSGPVGTNDGSMIGATVTTDADYGDVLSLNGDGQRVEVSNLLTQPANVTIAAWVNLTATDTQGATVVQIGSNMGLRLDNPSGQMIGFFHDGTTYRSVTFDETIAGTGWRHVAYTFNDLADTATLYLDGQEVATSTFGTSIVYAGGVTRIGGLGTDGYDFNGTMDDVRVYDRALTQSDIASLANVPGAAEAIDTVALTVTPINDAPVLDNTAFFQLTGITEDDTNNSGNTVAEIIASDGGDRITDADGDPEGIAIFSSSSTHGKWQYNTGSGWTDVGTVSLTESLLLRSTDSLRFVPDGENGENASFVFAAWDQTTGTAGTKVDTSSYGGTTAFSDDTDTANITVSSVNDDPTNAGSLPTDITVTEDLASQLDLSSIDLSDVDHGGGNLTLKLSSDTGGEITAAAMAGIAITANGSDAIELTGTLADLNTYLDNTTNLTYLHPTANLTGGDADILYVVINDNGNTGTGGGGNVSLGNVNIDITNVNDAPVMTAWGPVYNTTENASAFSAPISSVLQSSVSDVDPGAVEGIAVYAGSGDGGVLEYSTNGGGNWTVMPALDANNALLLRATDMIRFTPDTENGGTMTLDYYAWDQTTGTAGTSVDVTTRGGATAFSTANDTVTINTTSVNDEQVVSTNTGATFAEGSGGTITDAMLETTDVDTNDTPDQLVYTLTNNTDYGVLYLDAVALVTNDTFTQQDIDLGRISYTHDGTENHSDSFSFSVDDGVGTASTGTFNITVTPVNDNAVAITSDGGGDTATINHNESLSQVTQVTYSDGDLPGDAITYSIIGGTDETDFAIDGSGNLTFVTLPDFENPHDSNSDNVYTVIVQVSDGVYTDSQTITVNVQDVANETSLTVTTTSDVDDTGLGTSYNITQLYAVGGGADGHVSLREAIIAANNTTGQDTINFAILNTDAGYTGIDGVDAHWEITLTDILPTITESVILDGTSQTTFGGDTNPGTLGVVTEVGVNDTAIAGVERPEIEIIGDATLDGGLLISADNVTVTGFAMYGFSNSSGEAIELSDGITNANLTANVFGTSATGIADLGVTLNNHVHVRTVGADNGSLAGNLFAYSKAAAFHASNASDGWTLTGNQVIDGGLNFDNGDGFGFSDSDGATISGNYFSGMSTQAIFVGGGSNDVTISDNTIVNSGIGSTSGSHVQYDAIAIRSGSFDVALNHNIIADNYGAGITVNDGAYGVEITENSIYGNGAILSRQGTAASGIVGIDLQTTGESTSFGTAPYYTANDVGDADTGGNSLQNFPVISTASTDGTQISIYGTFNSLAGRTYRLEFFTTQEYANGHGQGEVFLGSVNVTTDGSGDATFSTSFAAALPTGSLVTATATDLTNNETSEFSQQFAVNDAPRIVGANQIANGEFTSDASGWSVSGNLDYAGGEMRFGQIGGAPGVLSQTFTTEVGKQYFVTFAYGDRSASHSQSIQVDANGGSLLLSESIVSGMAADTLQPYTYSFVADSTSTTLTFTDTSADHSGVRGYIDSIEVRETISPTLSDLDYTENDPATVVFADVNLGDVDDTHLESATIRISANFDTSEDELAAVDQFGIVSSWNGLTGELTLTGSATVDQYEAVIESVTYQNTDNNPNTATRTIEVLVNDGQEDSNVMSRNVTVESINDDPYNNGSLPASITVTEDVASNVDLSAIDLRDVDGSGGQDLTIKLSTSTGGNLYATTTAGVTVTGSGTANLTLTGARADLNAFLDIASSVTYQHSTENLNGVAADNIQVAANDNGNTGTGGGTDIIFGNVSVHITAVNDIPVISTGFDEMVGEFGGNTTTSVIGKATLESSNMIAVDSDQTYELSVTAWSGDGVGGNYDAGETHYLGFYSYDVDGNQITSKHTGKYAGAVDTTLAVDLVAGATQIVLNDATGWYDGGSDTNRSLAWYGYTNSLGETYADYTYTRNTLNDLWDENAIDHVTGVITLREAWSGPTILAGEAVRNMSPTGGTYQYPLLSNGPIDETGGDYSIVIGGANDTGATSQTQFRHGTAYIAPLVLANYTGTSNQLNISDFSVTTQQGTTVFTEDAGPIAIIDDDFAITDVDDTHAESVTVTLTNGKIGDILNVNEGAINALGISVAGIPTGNLSADGSITLTLTSDTPDSVTFADYQTALNEITFDNNSHDPDTTDRTMTLVVNDGDVDSAAENLVIKVHAVDDAPVVSTTADNPTYTEGGTAVSVFSGTTIDAVELGDTIGSFEISIAGISDGAHEQYRVNSEYIELVDGNEGTTDTSGFSYSVSVNAGVATLTISRDFGIGSGTAAALINNSAYQNTSEAPTGTTRTVTLESVTEFEQDGVNDTTVVGTQSVITITGVNDAPEFVGPELISNGTFDTDLSGWSTSGAVAYIGGEMNFGGGNAVGPHTASQTIATEAGQTYRLTFDYRDGSDLKNQSMQVTVDGDSNLLTTSHIVTDIDGNTYVRYEYTFTADSAASTITFTDTSDTAGLSDDTNNVDGRIDNVSVQQINGHVGSVSFTEGGSAVVLDGDLTLFDDEIAAGLDNYDNTILRISRDGGASGDDVYGGSGNLAALTESGSVVLSGETIGTVEQNSAGQLRLRFNFNLDAAKLNEVLQSITYENTSDAPPASVQLNWEFDDDNFGTQQGTGGEQTGTAYTIVNITGINDAPELDNSGTPTVTSITEDQINNGGMTVADLLATGAGGDPISDVDGDPDGIAITGRTNGNGQWEYSINGGTNWNAIGSVSDSNARLLRSTDLVRFNPDGENGITQTITFRAWDQSSGTAGTFADTTTNGGTTAFSSASETAQITVSDVNDAPVLDNSGTVTMTSQAEDAGAPSGAVGTVITDLVSLSGNVSDVDDGAVTGIAITAADTTNGTWWYSTNGGTNWNALGSVSDASARVLTADANTRVYFQSDADFTGTINDAITFRAWDQSAGTNGSLQDASTGGGTTAFSSATETADIAITPVNDAPELDYSYTTSFDTITEDDIDNAGQTVADILASSGQDILTDVDGDPEGIAIIISDPSNGTWEYSLDGGTNWTDVGVVDGNNALLLRSTDLLRFNPDGEQGTTTADIGFRAWDQTVGTAGTKHNIAGVGGTTAFSSSTETALIVVTDVNDAPVLDNSGALSLTTQNEDPGAPSGAVGTVITDLVSLSGNVTDVDSSPQTGIAITAADTTNGTWWYSTNNGSTWNALGSVSDASARVLNANSNTRIYFEADADFNGTISDAITFRAWDRSTGSNGSLQDASINGGTTAFSSATETADLTVNNVNDAPVLDDTYLYTLTSITEDDTSNGGQTVASILASNAGTGITDADSGASEGIAIRAISVSNGHWEFSTNGGTNWSDMGTVSTTSALVLRDTDMVRFIPDEQNGEQGNLTFIGWDQTDGSTAGTKVNSSTTGGASSFSNNVAVARIIVTDVNDAPTVSSPATATVNEGGSLTFDILGAGVFDTDDADGDNLTVTLTADHAAIALSQTSGLTVIDGDGTDGTLQFSGSTADIDAALYGLDYDSQAGYNGSASLVVLVDDGSLTDSTTVAITVNPGQTLFVWDGGGATNDWTDADNWNHDLVPEADDIVVFNATSTKDSTLDAAFAGAISEIQVNAGYTGTLTFDRTLTNTGDLLIADGTVDTNGQNVDTEGFINITGGTLTIDGSTLNLGDDFIHSGGTLNTNGSTLYFDGTGDRSLQTSAQIDNIEIDHVGTLTLLSDLSFAGDFTHSQGTVDFGGHEVSVSGTSGQIVDASGITFDDFEFNNSNTVTIVGGLDIDGDLTYTNAVTINGAGVTASGNVATLDSAWSGTSVLTLDGTTDQTISTGGGTGELGNLVINKASGTVRLLNDIELGGDFTHTSGGWDTNGQVVEFQGHNTTIDAGSATFDDVILNSTVAGSRVIVGTLDVDGDFTFTNAGTLNSGQITVAGDINYGDDSYSGTTMIIADGTGNQIVSATTGTAKAEHLTINKASGTLTFGTDLTINGVLNHVAGTVADLTHTITFGNNSGTITASSINFDDVIFDSNYSKNISGVLNVGGDLTITSVNALNVGEIRVAGNITSSDTSVGGNSQITLNGTGTQTISGDDLSDGSLNIDKTTGTAILADDLVLDGTSQDVNVISGTLDLNGHTINATGDVVIDDSLLIGTGAITNDLTLDNDAIVRLSASSTSVYESIAVGGTLTLGLGAQLEIDLTGMTAGGYLQDIFTSTTLAGTFDAITLLNDSVGFTIYDEYDSPSGAVDIFLNSNPTGSIGDVNVNEDAPDTVIDLDAAFSDLEHADNELTYSLIGYSSPAFLNSANIDNGAGTLTLDYAAEQHGTTTITVRATDARGEFTDVTFNVTVNSIEDAPIITGGPATSSLTETNSGLTDSGTFTVSDSDIADNVTAAVDNVAVSGTGASSVPGSLDNATLQSFLSVSPTAILDGTETTDTLTWNFNSGAEAFDFLADGETLILTYTISATDDSASTLSDTETVTVTITGTNDGPSAIADQGTATESGGIANATSGSDATGNVLSNDTDDDVSDTHNVIGVAAGSQASASGSVGSTVNGTYGNIQINSNGTYTFAVDENDPSVQALRTSSDTLQEVFTYTMSDSEGASSTAELTITIQGANDTPHDLSTTGLTIIESANNGDSVGTITHSDVDAGDTATYTLTDSANGRFAIDPNTGVITVVDASQLDFESDTSHSITVQVSDTAGATYQEVFKVAITDADEFDVSTPTDVNASANEVAENSTTGTSVGITADAFDLDATNNTITYSLTSNPDGLFQIDPNSGEVTTAASIDRETVGGRRSITVQAASSDGSTATQSFDIDILDVDEFDVTVPTDADAASNEVDENSIGGTVVGVTADAFDLDATNNTITYSLTSNPGGRFQIDPSTGVVTVAGGIDRETAASYDIEVTATSSDSSSESQTFTIQINDVDEFDATAAGDTDASNNEVDENSAFGSTVGLTVAAFDSDATNSSIQYAMVDDAGGRFDVDVSTGQVTVAAGASLDFESHTSHDVTIRGSSDDGSFIDQTFTIQIRDVNEAPVAGDDGTYTVAVGQPTVLSGPHILTNDVDVDSDPLQIVIVVHPANGTLNVATDGTVTYTPNSGFFGSDSFQYQAHDGSLLSNTATVAIDVVGGGSSGGSGSGSGSGDSGGGDSGGSTGDSGDGSSDSGSDSSDSGSSSGTDGNSVTGPIDPNSQDSDETSQSDRQKQDGSGEENGDGESADGPTGGTSDSRGVGIGGAGGLAARGPRRFGMSEATFVYDALPGSDGLLNDLMGTSEINSLLTWHLSKDGSVRINEAYENEDIDVGAVGTTLGLASIGYVLWALRGGMFIATMYAGIPSWRMLDPASLLSAYRGADDAAQDRVEEMLD